MSQEVMIFWLLHIVIGVVVPVLALTGCCRREEEAQAAKKAQKAQRARSPQHQT